MSSHIIGHVDLPMAALRADIELLSSLNRLPEVYDEFSTGFYKNISLWNASGDGTDSRYRDTDRAMITEFGRLVPDLEALLRSIFDFSHVTMVRARDLIDAMVLPHRDFIELDKEVASYYRVFLPLNDNPHAYHSDSAGVFRMKPGEVWFLDAKQVHAAANLSTLPRLFICLDFAFDDSRFHPSDIFVEKSNYRPGLRPYFLDRPHLPASFLEDLAHLRFACMPSALSELFVLLSKLHFSYESMPSEVFDWLEYVVGLSGDPSLIERVRLLRRHMIEHREFGYGLAINSPALLETASLIKTVA
jgi:hypothetical protein